MSREYSGILNIDKPTGWSSHDVVGKVRRILGQRSVGHAGTLDPLATGVLLVCAGQATRVAEYLMASQKVYRAVVRLGASTDTYDRDGQVVATAPVPDLSGDDLRMALAPFVGDIQQVPPAYSAIKVDGQPLHRRARRGETVELRPRPVTIYRVDLLSWQPPDLTLEVACGPGTYIRSLAHDLGAALGCGAHLTALERVRSGGFGIEDAITLETLSAAAAAGRIAQCLLPLESALRGLTPVQVDEAMEGRLRHGQAIPTEAVPATSRGYARAADGRVLAILEYDSGSWRPRKVFVDGSEARAKDHDDLSVTDS